MTHHRGLVITLIVAVVVAGVGVGVLALATNDTDESVQAEVSSPYLGRNLATTGLTGRAYLRFKTVFQSNSVTIFGSTVTLTVRMKGGDLDLSAGTFGDPNKWTFVNQLSESVTFDLELLSQRTDLRPKLVETVDGHDSISVRAPDFAP